MGELWARMLLRSKYLNPSMYETVLSPTVIKFTPTIMKSEPMARIASDGRINQVFHYFYSDKPDQIFQLVKDTEPGNYSIHFKTDKGALSGDEVQGLVDRIVSDLPEGSRLGTWGSVSKGGFSGLNRFKSAGMTPLSDETRTLSFKDPNISEEIADKYKVTLNLDGTVNWPVYTKPIIPTFYPINRVINEDGSINPEMARAAYKQFRKSVEGHWWFDNIPGLKPIFDAEIVGDVNQSIVGETSSKNRLKSGGSLKRIESGKSGIHIKPENKGKFTETKKGTGKTTEELTHSKNPLTRKRAIFAQNAKKWNHKK